MTNPSHPVLTPPNHDGPKTVVVVGAQRGGTSMVAGALRELGVHLGNRLGENHEDSRFLTKDLDRIREVIAKSNAEFETWGWKMPHSIEYIDEIQDEIRNPHVIIVWRNLLSTTQTHVNREGADFMHALVHSGRIQDRMIEKAGQLRCPTLLVNYDKAVMDKTGFVKSITDFLGLTPSASAYHSCLNFIDPQQGYKQVSFTFYDVEDAVADNHPTVLDQPLILKDLKPTPDAQGLEADGHMPRMIIRRTKENPLPDDFVVVFRNHTDHPSYVMILFDFDWVFSRNMGHKVTVDPGVHAYRVRNNGAMTRVGLIPSFTDGVADVSEFELRAVSADKTNRP